MSMLMRVANWHGEKAVLAYQFWSHSNNESDLRDYVRHVTIAKKLWKALKK